MKKRILLSVFALFAALLLSGCAMQTVEEMYALPKRSEAYSQLQSAIDKAMVGMTYSAPVSGENQQSVQMVDLTGDGVEEYIVFAECSGEKPLRVLIFSQEEDGTCTLLETIESKGAAFERVEYVDFDESAGCELVVGRRVSDQLQRSVSVYSFSNGWAEQILSMGYSKFLTCDMNRDDRSELLVLRAGESDADNGSAVLFSFQNGGIERSVEAELSEEPSRVKRMMNGTLAGGEPAVYVASALDEGAIVTDVFTMKEGRFINLSFANEADTSIQTLKNYYVYAEDIDDDGVIELPSLIAMKAVSPWNDADQKFLIRWSALGLDGNEVDKLYTFHNYLGGWYLQLDSAWASRVTVEDNSGTFTFYVWDESYREATALFSIYVLTGTNRDEEAVQNGCFALYRAEGVAYAARLGENAAQYEIEEEHLIECFRLIQQDWQTGET